MFFIHLRKNRGSALLTVVIILAVLMILGVSILNVSVSEGKQAIYHQNKVQATYFARTAVDDLANYVFERDKAGLSINNQSHVFDNDSIKYDVSLTGGSMNLTIGDQTENVDTFTISGTGYRSNVTADMDLVLIRPTIAMVLKSALYTFDDTNLQTWRVCGDVSSLGQVNVQEQNTLQCGGTLFDGLDDFDDYFYELLEDYFIEYPVDQKPRKIEILKSFDVPEEEAIDLTADGEEEFDEDTVFENISIPNGNSVRFIANGHQERKIVIDSLSTGQQGDIYFSGGGLIKVYVMDSLSVNGDMYVQDDTMVEIYAVTNNGPVNNGGSNNTTLNFHTPIKVNPSAETLVQSDQVKFLLDKGSTMNIQANGELRAYILGPGADVNIQAVSGGGTNAGVYGAIIANNLTGNAGRIWFEVPDSTRWDIEFSLMRFSYQ